MATQAPEWTREDYEAALAEYNEAHPRRPGGCPECGGIVVRKSVKGPPPLFCGEACATACERRKLSDGRAIIDLAKAWRAARNNKSDARIGSICLTEMCSILDKMIDRDRAKGRTVPMLLSYVARVGNWNHDWFTQTSNIASARKWRERQAAEAEAEGAPPPMEENEIVEGLRSIDERFGHQLSNMEANALRFAIERYATAEVQA
jgi:hypothetical protein